MVGAPRSADSIAYSLLTTMAYCESKPIAAGPTCLAITRVSGTVRVLTTQPKAHPNGPDRRTRECILRDTAVCTWESQLDTQVSFPCSFQR